MIQITVVCESGPYTITKRMMVPLVAPQSLIQDEQIVWKINAILVENQNQNATVYVKPVSTNIRMLLSEIREHGIGSGNPSCTELRMHGYSI